MLKKGKNVKGNDKRGGKLSLERRVGNNRCVPNRGKGKKTKSAHGSSPYRAGEPFQKPWKEKKRRGRVLGGQGAVVSGPGEREGSQEETMAAAKNKRSPAKTQSWACRVHKRRGREAWASLGEKEKDLNNETTRAMCSKKIAFSAVETDKENLNGEGPISGHQVQKQTAGLR